MPFKLEDVPFFAVGPTPAELVIGTASIVLILLFFIAWLVIDARKNRNEDRIRLRQFIMDQSSERQLLSDERALFEEMVYDLGAFPGPKYFESRVESLLARGISPDLIHDLRNKLGFGKREGRPLASTRELETGLEITFGTANHVWRGVVFEVNELALILRVSKDAGRMLEKGTEVTASLWRDLDARYVFRTTIEEVRFGVAPLVYLSHPHSLDRYQDREFMRADVDWPVKLRRLTDDEFKKAMMGALAGGDKAVREIDGRVIDISEGGMRMKGVDLDAGDRVVTELPLPNAPLLVIASVIAKTYEGVRCQFINLSMGERDQIHREIMKPLRKKLHT